MTSTPSTQQDRIHRERAEDVRPLLAQWDDLMQSHGATDLGRVLDRDYQGMQEIIGHLRYLDDLEAGRAGCPPRGGGRVAHPGHTM